MTYNEVFPVIYREVKEQGAKINSLELTKRLQFFEENIGEITKEHIAQIVEKIVWEYNNNLAKTQK